MPFTGTINSYDLNGELINAQPMINGQPSARAAQGGRSQTCYQTVEIEKVCLNQDGTRSQATGLTLPCLYGYEIVITISYSPECCINDGNGQSGGGGVSYRWSNGTFVPFEYWGDGGPGGGGTGGSGGGGGSGGSSGSGQGDSGVTGNNVAVFAPTEYKVCPGDDALIPGSLPCPGDPVDNSDLLQELSNLLAEDPFLLLEIDCNQLPKWQGLAQSQVPANLVEKINQLQSSNNSFDDWAIQTLNGASGTVVNMDYFSVAVSTLPYKPGTNQRFTPTEFLDYFRRNINSFVAGSTFSPYCQIPSICQQETNLWNSSNPLGSILYIDIPGDDGVVMCSKYTLDYWHFVTLEAPDAGNHPVSGTRQFGFEPNASGGYNFFVRGVDRFDSNLTENLAYVRFVGNPFQGADDLWESFQQGMRNFVNSHGGVSAIEAPIKYRPDWNKVDQVLMGQRPVSDLGCN